MARQSAGLQASAIANGHDFIVRYFASGKKEVVIEKEMNSLTLEEAQQHPQDSIKATRDDLQRWRDYKASDVASENVGD